MINSATRAARPASGLKSSRHPTSFSEMQGSSSHSLLPKVGNHPLIQRAIFPRIKRPRFKKDEVAQKALAQTVTLADVKSNDFDTVFYPGGHGPMWDLAESP